MWILLLWPRVVVEAVMTASGRYHPGTRDFTEKFGLRLGLHGDEPMSNVEYEKNDYPKNVLDSEGIPEFDDGYPPPDPLSNYWSAWNLTDGVIRHPVLIMEDMEQGYDIYIEYVVPHAVALLEAFRERDWPIVWTNWVRRADDGFYGSLDRFYGPQGISNEENPMYMYGKDGAKTLDVLQPKTTDEFQRTIKSLHLSKFADLDDQGNFILYPMLVDWGVDTVIVVGAWTDDCILATVYDAADKLGLDAVLVDDAVATASILNGDAIKLQAGTVSHITNTSHLLTVMNDGVALQQAPNFRSTPSSSSLAAGTQSSSSSQPPRDHENNNAYLFKRHVVKARGARDPLRYFHSDDSGGGLSISLPLALGISAIAALLSAAVVAAYFQARDTSSSSGLL